MTTQPTEPDPNETDVPGVPQPTEPDTETGAGQDGAEDGKE